MCQGPSEPVHAAHLGHVLYQHLAAHAHLQAVASTRRSRRRAAADCRPRDFLYVAIASASSAIPAPVLCREVSFSNKHRCNCLSTALQLATSQPSRTQVRQQVCPAARSAETLQRTCCSSATRNPKKSASRPLTPAKAHMEAGGGAFTAADLPACERLGLRRFVFLIPRPALK